MVKVMWWILASHATTWARTFEAHWQKKQQQKALTNPIKCVQTVWHFYLLAEKWQIRYDEKLTVTGWDNHPQSTSHCILGEEPSTALPVEVSPERKKYLSVKKCSSDHNRLSLPLLEGSLRLVSRVLSSRTKDKDVKGWDALVVK